MPDKDRCYPGRASIDAYGNGGFRFADLSHRGSLLMVPSGIYAWEISEINNLTKISLERVLVERDDIDFLLLGTGRKQELPPESVREAFERADMGLEYMDTGAACRTYNVLLAEQRAVAAALIAVE